jgi:hypothetical protein
MVLFLAYVLVTALRRLALRETELQNATAGTIRLKLLKLGALCPTHQVSRAFAGFDHHRRRYGTAAIRRIR